MSEVTDFFIDVALFVVNLEIIQVDLIQIISPILIELGVFAGQPELLAIVAIGETEAKFLPAIKHALIKARSKKRTKANKKVNDFIEAVIRKLDDVKAIEFSLASISKSAGDKVAEVVPEKPKRKVKAKRKVKTKRIVKITKPIKRRIIIN